ncbi:MAG: hypothetical protein CFH35_01768 [Alphaproteobacteria bacterium MarineAlpha9_Bin5]|jgi:predicted protein tyrosine phosphatase|nr:MAG: hypothetical protein CFH36_01037 [Alphaproteobacteria bacterium MarineAlpha9_Bin6]PPR36335.1 MAG: hypothetical protein CFH35_01768 [Alphaproteobacteria bacterium MarineAlpha9_Bin5]HIB17643.1 protein-tyrosine-phosphatase [Alphaproteobacteria bacterium]HIO03192.1 protein-tyrosine-phosphatase [Alphaproteobacteria bacterium]
MLPYRLSICGLNELTEFVNSDVSHIISILDPGRADPEELAEFPSQNRVVFRFDDVIFTQPGHTHPGANDIDNLIEWGRGLNDARVHHLLVHCHAGVSRSTAAAAILMADKNPGHEPEVFDQIDRIRRRNWPNSMMIDLADQVLGCNGAFNAALRAHHAHIAKRDPNLAELIKLHGRAHEIPEGI